jgi:hypothetical protein
MRSVRYAEEELIVTGLWRYHRRATLVVALSVAALFAAVGVAAIAVQSSGQSTHRVTEPSRHRSAAQPNAAVSPTPVSPASGESPSSVTPADVASWNAIAPMKAATSPDYKAITGPIADDPYKFATAFLTELFTQDYRKPRSELLAWAQYESVPIVTNGVPRADEAKGLLDSLTDITWDSEPTAPVPPEGQWLSLQAQGGYQTVSNVRVSADSLWQQEIDAGHATPDKKMVVLDATMTATLHTYTAGKATTSSSLLAAKVMLGTSTRGDGYGAMYVGTYVVTAVD